MEKGEYAGRGYCLIHIQEDGGSRVLLCGPILPCAHCHINCCSVHMGPLPQQQIKEQNSGSCSRIWCHKIVVTSFLFQKVELA